MATKTKVKQKTKKLVTKRVRVTKTGKVLRRQAFKRHLNTGKSSKRKRRLSKVISTDKVRANKIKKLLGK